MSDYSRFVSYIYLYENGIKTMNAGFVKVESRNAQCRVSVSLKNVYSGSEYCKAYMFIRFGKELRGIYLGNIRIKNHSGEWTFRTDTGNIAGSGYRLDQVSGMIIEDGQGKNYGTRWDHGDLDMGRFNTRWQQEADQGVEAAQIPDMTEELPKIEVPEQEMDKDLQMLKEAVKQPEGRQTGDAPMITVDEMHENTDEKQLGPGDRWEETGPDIQKAATAPEMDVGRIRNFEKMLDTCPRMYPFSDDAIEECVRLEPQDIGRMPMDCWCYGSNSFLLHGYYSYRHLILARLQSGNGKAYILGVPGTNHSQEAFMANMFGFRTFKPIREEKGEASDFGYWYKSLMQA